MNYELCKKLKDAGFKQSGWNGNTITEDGTESSDYEDLVTTEEGECYLPTLSELIEAFENRFICISKNPFEDKQENQEWIAEGFGEGIERSVKIQWSGKTPEEAVANLWLELNKK